MIEDVDKLLVLSDVTRKAAKSHRCCECGRGIERGEQYRYETGVSDGRVVTHKTCAHCLIVREWLSGECGGWVYTMTEEDLVEHCNGYGHPMSVYRLAVGQRRRWRTRKGALMPLPTCPPTTHERAGAA
ncbi:MAG: hypothetical protein IT178_16395 [Acidobacteria bacterium]|nr:hypothetical protein [Acidobacteriota bacterium]